MVGGPQDTLDQPWNRGHEEGLGFGPPLPGLLMIFAAGAPRLLTIPLAGEALTIGRGFVGGPDVDDGAMSRRHAEVRLDGGSWHVQDLGSRNGTAVDARRLSAPFSGDARLLRCGDTLFLLCRDLRTYVRARVETSDGAVVGPTLQRVWQEIASIGSRGATLHITGETGAGKELAARCFHRAGTQRGGPFVAVNCATIPAAIAERLLFGAKRGAYSGADADSEGYVQAAHGGTLFLDEVAELEPLVQAKLLRVLETREVLPLGAAHPRKVDVRVCSATHGGLQARVADGRFREDLFFRLGRPEVRVPALRERAEEIPWLIGRALAEALPAHVSMVERAVAAAWPGNVRELLIEVCEAARRAAAEGSAVVEARHLRAAAVGAALGAAVGPLESSSPAAPPARSRAAATEPLARDRIEEALRAHDGNISRAARALRVHRTQLRRWMERYGIAADS